MNWKKIKFHLRLHWIKILVALGLLALAVSLAILITKGIRAWNESESYLRQSQMAAMPLQMYIYLIMGLVQAVVFTYMYYWMFFKKGMSGFTQSQKKSIAGESIGITWNDVIGMDEAKEEALEVVKLIKDRAGLTRIGGKILRGILMLGPPGCGKTYLAKAIATEAGLPFISMSGSEFVEMFVGVGAGRVRSLFKRARQLAELEGGCLIFIDEMDAIGAQRAMDRGFGGTTEHNTTLNQLLVEMDGLKEKEYNIVLIGATNVQEKVLDEALLRPGRFDRKIYVDKPNLEDRGKLFSYYLGKVKYDPQDVKIDRLARITVGQSPADISNIVREAALITVRTNKETISMREIDEARERIALGIKRRIKLSPKERLQTAYHEAGHAIATYFFAPTQDVFKVTITPRGPTGGVTWTPEREDTFIKDSNNLLSQIKVCLGSYAAEKIKYNATTNGVYQDFSTAMYYAHQMVWNCGMGKSGLLGNWEIKGNVSEEMRNTLDRDVQHILHTCLNEVTELLKKEEPLLDRLAQELIAKDELNYDEIEAIFKEFGKSRPQ